MQGIGTLSSHMILQAWEWGEARHPIDRALLLLDLAQPGQEPATLATLSVGQRNAALLDLRARLFGSQLSCFVTCPACGEALELELLVDDLRGPDRPSSRPEYELTIDGITLRFRLPNSHDLAALVGVRDLEAARRQLIRRCLLEARRDGVVIAVEEVPAATVVTLADEMHGIEPPAALMLGLTCVECAHAWSASLDIVSYLWTELSVAARRLLRDVHALALAYGWHEDAILSMSEWRRQQYLGMIHA